MRSAAFLAFFLSGASSLIFQSIWSRMLAHVFGASHVAISTTVTVFMAGLGLGAFVAGRFADRIKHPLITYGIVEGLVGIWALLVPFLVDSEGWLAGVNAWLRNDVELWWMRLGIRFLVVVPILLVPTTLMGSSLPLLSRHFVRAFDPANDRPLPTKAWFGMAAIFGGAAAAVFFLTELNPLMAGILGVGAVGALLTGTLSIGRRSRATGGATKMSQNDVGSIVGALYAVNTFGAVAGVALGSFVFLPALGVSITNVVAACMNFLLFALIFAFRKQLLGETWKPGEKLSWRPGKEVVVHESPAEPDEDGEEAETAVSAEDADEDDEASEKKAEKKAKKKREKAARKRATSDDDVPEGAPDPDLDGEEKLPDIALPVPAIARKLAFFAFAASGLASLCYEVVWTRSLAMTIGSSFQAFALILMTFLIGIGGGSTVASGVIAGKRLLPTVAITSLVLVAFGNATWGIDEDWLTWLLLDAVFAVPIIVIWGAVAQRRRAVPSPNPPVKAALLMLAVPAIGAVLNLVTFEGRLPAILAAVVLCLCAFLALVVALRRYPVLQLATMPLFIAVAAFVNYLFQDEIPCAFAQLVASIETLYESVGLVQFFMFLTVALCTLPATAGMGAMFPLVLRVWTRGGDQVGRDVGTVYAGNTLGSILGAWLPGFVLMQSLGMERTIITGMFVYLGVALLLLVAAAADRGETKAAKEGDAEAVAKSAPPGWYALSIYILAPLIPPMVVVLALLGWKPSYFDSLEDMRWNLSQMTLGVFRVSLAEDACSEAWGEPDLVYYHDGLSTTVSVERWGRHYALKNNGKVDASNGDDMPTQIMVGAYPLLMHPEGPEGLDVAVVGFGSGVTVGTVLKFPVERVDVMELERSIPEASKFFEDVNGLDYVLQDFPYIEMDRLTIVNDDGRNYLASTDQQYDVIVSEPSNPWITGVSDLFTTDHWRITKQRLREGGIYCQWVQLYELSPENIKTIYRTFASQFEHVVVFAAEDLSSDTVMLGSDSPLPLDLERVRSAYQLEGAPQELERAYIHSPFDVFARVLLASKEEVMQFTQIEHRLRGGEWIAYPDSNNPPDRGCPEDTCRREPVVLNTDDNAHIEFQAPRDLIGFQRFEGYLANIYSPDWPYGRVVLHAEGFGEGSEAAENYAEMAMSLIAHGKKAEAAAFIARSQDEGGSRTTAVAAEVLTRLMTGEGEPTIAIEPPVPGPQMAAREARTLTEGFERVRQAVDIGSYGTALGAMEDIPAPLRLHSGPSMRLLYGYLLFKTASTYQSRYGEAIEQFEDLIRSDEQYVLRHPEVFYFLGRAHDAELNFDKGLRNMRVYVEARLRAQERRQREQEDAEGAPTTDGEPGEGEAPTSGEAEGEESAELDANAEAALRAAEATRDAVRERAGDGADGTSEDRPEDQAETPATSDGNPAEEGD